MATLNARLARWCAHHAKLVVTIWLLLLVGLGTWFALAGATTTAKVTIPGTEAQRAYDALTREFPEASGEIGQVVLRAPAGETLTEGALRNLVLATTKEANELPGVVGALDPFTAQSVSPDGRYALIAVQFVESLDQITPKQLAAYEALGADAEAGGLTIARGGNVAMTETSVSAWEGLGVLIAFVVLAMTLGSLVLAGMTMLNALVGVGVAMCALMLLSNASPFMSATPVLALMLGLAVAIDYSLFITSRHRHFLSLGHEPHRAISLAAGTAGSAVVFAGLTVMIALSALSVVGIPFLTTMGLAAAGAVLIGVLVAMTLLPALLGLIGARAAGTHDAAERGAADETQARGFRWARWVVRWRVAIVIVVIAAIGVLATPTLDMRLALPDGSTAAVDSGQHQAYELISEGFGEGANAVLAAVVIADDQAAVDEMAQRVSAALGQVKGVVAVMPPQPNATGSAAVIRFTPSAGPTSEQTHDVVVDARRAIRKLDAPKGVDVAVTGATAVSIDVSDKLASALPVYLAVVIGLSMLVLLVVFRSIIVPVKATLGFLLSVGATFGTTIAVFQWGWLSDLVGLANAGPLVSFLPVLLIGILFGLAMDYELFLVSRMREDFTHGASAHDAIIAGVGHGARVVTAAATIMAAVFAGFILNEDPIIKSIGFALAFGVVIDAFVIRLLLVPAVMSLLGARAWWLPRWLDRILPNVDIEGARLDQSRPS